MLKPIPIAGLACVAALVCVHGAVSVRGQQPAPPQFRTGVEMARLDVTVVDDRTRKPMRGLRSEDFVVTFFGEERPVMTLSESNIETAARPAAARVGVGGDVATNAPVRGRLLVIVMDDTSGSLNMFHRQTAPRIGHAVVDAMAPEDRAAVVFANTNRNAVGFTADRNALHRAIDTFDPKPLPPGVGPEMSRRVLNRTRRFLDEMPGYRRAVVWITLGVDLKTDPTLRAIGGVPVYSFHTRGLDARVPGIGAPSNASIVEHNAMRTLATDSGGEAYVDTNTPAAHVPDMFEELASYYTLGFPSAGLKDNAWITIKVRQPHAQVVPAGFSYNAPRRAVTLPPTATAAAVAPRASAGLFEALAGPLPSGDLPLSLTATPVATSTTESAMVLTLGFTPPPSAVAGDAYNMQLLVFDGEGRKEVFRQSQTIHAGKPGYGEVLLRVPVPAGRYYLRLSFGHEKSGTTGSVYAPSVVVPDFKKSPLSLSGVLIGRAESGAVGGRQAIADVLPFAPTAVRDFARTDHVGAMLRVHQKSGAAPIATTIETTIFDDQGTVVATARDVLAATAFATGSSEFRYDVPLSTLAPGSFLLRIVATAGKYHEERTVRFNVQPSTAERH